MSLVNMSTNLSIDTSQITCVGVKDNPERSNDQPENEKYILSVAIKGAGFIEVTGEEALTVLERLKLNDSMNKGRFFANDYRKTDGS